MSLGLTTTFSLTTLRRETSPSFFQVSTTRRTNPSLPLLTVLVKPTGLPEAREDHGARGELLLLHCAFAGDARDSHFHAICERGSERGGGSVEIAQRDPEVDEQIGDGLRRRGNLIGLPIRTHSHGR